ncbi:MAG: rubrerythrin family protein [candidate division WOR-3 bacterium]|nr:rubrerythrin family protein [candidate division WOR-3 bacterium]
MKEMTKKALSEAFAGESMAHMKYLIFAEVAEKEGFINVARLFKAIAFAEFVHARNHARNLDYIKQTDGNLQTGIDGETFEVNEMYPAYLAIAVLQNEKGAELAINYALAAEKIHAELYKQAKVNVQKGEDIKVDEIYICPICGYTHIGVPPEKCPVCNAGKDKFYKF